MTVQLLHPVSDPGAQGDGDLAAAARWCVAALGAELTAYLAGADSVRMLDELVEARDAHAAVRLRAAADVVDLFARANLLGTAAGWLREIGAAKVHDRSPAQLLRDGSDESLTLVLDGARAFVAH